MPREQKGPTRRGLRRVTCTLGWCVIALASACLGYAAVHLSTGTAPWVRPSAIGAYVLFGWFLLIGIRLVFGSPPADSHGNR